MDGCRQRPWVSANEKHNNKKQPWRPMTSLPIHVKNTAANCLHLLASVTAHLLDVSLSHYVISTLLRTPLSQPVVITSTICV